ncbi:MAG TPA: hypothetical protein PLF04_06990 [Candidatus Fermentibacter daniensis]|jgi:hypothetical protein|nr:MAG: hypothetical protein AO394_06940 [Candidatus Fermentibacter daniensis]KZD17468.1 MAG: hypothetical protein AO395_01830 [Candidatus Fermentibacter daniensis]HOA05565.1 hypothetical protein [Candidatus Fermentibacter daniensis]HOG54070.1 hypothetical protein [Candidatus Fermentibacter daniensis]HOZ18063.1 hypothetical protein [Candidatus Fermentibacter daniensis]
MADNGAFEVRRGDKLFRAASVEVLVKWASERRINADDQVRPAGTAEWRRAAELPELSRLLDPSNWWHVRMGDKTYTAPDFETVVRWTREGRLASDAVIEGPRTPPGGVLAQGLPRLSPFLRPPMATGDDTPPRLRIDKVEYHPGDLDTIRTWIADSRVPVDAEISMAGGPWEPITECGAFEPETWPRGAWGERVPDDDHPSNPSKPGQVRSGGVPFEAYSGRSSGASPASAVPGPGRTSASADRVPPGPSPLGQYRIMTGRGEIVAGSPAEIRRLLKNRRIHSFDEVLNPTLPDGRSSVAAVLEGVGLRGGRGFPAWAVWAIVILVLALAFFVIDPLRTGYLGIVLEKIGISWT